MGHFWKDGICIEEMKSLALIAAFIGTLIFALVVYGIRGDISSNMLTLLLTKLGFISGYNVVHDVTTYLQSKNNNNNNNYQNYNNR